MNLRSWYGNAIRIPATNSYQFASFVASCVGLTTTIMRSKDGSRIRVRFVKGGTASADQTNQLININANFLSGYFQGATVNGTDAIVSNILGVIVHEAAHFAYSPPTLKDYADFILARTPHLQVQSVAALIGNVIEDIYIEAEIGREFPRLAWTLDTINETFFSAEHQESILASANLVTAPPTTQSDFVKVSDSLILAKVRSEFSVNPWLKGVLELAHSAVDAYLLDERLEIALHLYNELFQDLGKDEEDEEEEEGESVTIMIDAENDGDEAGEEGEGEEEEGKGSGSKEIDVESLEKAVDAARRKVVGATIDHTKEEMPRTYYDSSESREVNRLIEECENIATTNIKDESDFGGSRTEVFYEHFIPESTPLEMDVRYVRLAEVGRQRATVNRPYGQDKSRGNHIRRLHRIATDGRIFAEPIVMGNYKPMQVIILVDASSSMHGSFRSEEDGAYHTRIDSALKAALGAAVGLSEARCEVAVYAHTGDVTLTPSVDIYTAKTFNDPITQLAGRLNTILTARPTSQNRDGYAIAYIGRKFTDSRKRQLLLVISDGSPMANKGYDGPKANEHTKKAVDELRRQGVDVLSISITSSASSTNDYIYGRENNVYNQDPNVIEDVIKRLMGV